MKILPESIKSALEKDTSSSQTISTKLNSQNQSYTISPLLIKKIRNKTRRNLLKNITNVIMNVNTNTRKSSIQKYDEYRNSLLRTNGYNHYTEHTIELKNTNLGQFLAVVNEVIETNKTKNIEKYRFVIHPHGSFRKFWDTLMLFSLIYVATVIPFQLAFLSDKLTYDRVKQWLLAFIIDRILDIIFISDIIINFRSSHLDSKEKVIFNSYDVAIRYLSSSFFTDLLSIIPYDFIAYQLNIDPANVGSLRFPKLLRLLRLAKILKVLRASDYFQRYEQSMSIKYGWLRLMKFVALIIIMIHWMGCAIGISIVFWPNRKNWTTDVDGYSIGLSPFELYCSAIYWAAMTITTIGYGDITAHNPYEKLFFTFLMLFGAGMFAYVVGTMCSLVQGLNTSIFEFQQRMDEVNGFMKNNNLPDALRLRIRKYLLYKRKAKVTEDHDLLNSFSPAIRNEVVLYKYQHILSSVPQFRGAPTDFLAAIALSLKTIVFSPNELIITYNRSGDTMYILNRGRVQIEKLNSSGKLVVTGILHEGVYFGERALISNSKRQNSIRALTYAETSCLKKSELNNIVADFPIVQLAIRKSLIKELLWRAMSSGKLRMLSQNPTFLKKQQVLADLAVQKRALDTKKVTVSALSNIGYNNIDMEDGNSINNTPRPANNIGVIQDNNTEKVIISNLPLDNDKKQTNISMERTKEKNEIYDMNDRLPISNDKILKGAPSIPSMQHAPNKAQRMGSKKSLNDNDNEFNESLRRLVFETYEQSKINDVNIDELKNKMDKISLKIDNLLEYVLKKRKD